MKFMKYILLTIYVFFLGLSLFLLLENMQPGLLGHFNVILTVLIFFFIILPCSAASLILMIISLIMLKYRRKDGLSVLKHLGISALVLLAAFLISACDIPLRSAFFFSRNAFESLLEAPDFSPEKTDGTEVGIWKVDQCRAGTGGGVYFRIGTGMDGISPDEMSYGFAYNPDTSGSPFGKAGYRLTALSGKWYYFSVSDDY